MTLVTDALDRIARGCRISAPSSWITATGLSHVEIRDDFLQQTVDDLRKRVDWPSPVKQTTTITGDGSEDYNLPTDFARLQLGHESVYETTTSRRWGTPVEGDGAWTQMKTVGTAGTERYYRLKGYDGAWQISLYPNPSATESLTVSYVSKNWMADSGGTAGSTFSAADDVLLYPRRPVELGTIMRWRLDKGLDLRGVDREYEAWIATESNRNNGRNVIAFGEPQARKPMRVPVPDFIPSS